MICTRVGYLVDEHGPLPKKQIENNCNITLGMTFSNSHYFGPSMNYEVYISKSNGLDALFKSTRQQFF
jgi:hypothetical protein